MHFILSSIDKLLGFPYSLSQVLFCFLIPKNFVLGYRQLTILWQIQVNSDGTQPCIYVCVYIYIYTHIHTHTHTHTRIYPPIKFLIMSQIYTSKADKFKNCIQLHIFQYNSIQLHTIIILFCIFKFLESYNLHKSELLWKSQSIINLKNSLWN